ncbi:MAG: sigma-54-dependent Fis family transcriptional regulator, partial [Gammaproteobacteria bacterium]|nr:sigma-54-dependent Fis family transcriptional regulator [Gammaproteobacteria bacterium]
VKGSFTGAHADRAGYFEAAEGGTLFLDEIGEVSPALQVKLLRVLQDGTFSRVGSNETIKSDVRIIAATHKNLSEEVTSGRFREDLYYRLNVVEIRIPPLRERLEDIPLLAEFFLDRLSGGEASLRPLLATDAVDALNHYGFPGNIRELENILERAMTLCEDNTIRADDLQLSVPVKIRREEDDDFPDDDDTVAGDVPVPDDLPQYLDDMEKQVITKALEEARYNKTLAAKRLGITFRALRYRLKKLGLE